MEAAISVTGLHVVRGGRAVLPDLALEVRAGAVTGLLGPSGSGKTTLMRAIVGVQIVAAGTVTVLGEPAGSRSLRYRVAYMTQSPSVYADLTVLENLRYFARVLDVPARNVDAAIATVELDAHRDQIVSSLSGGESARVSLAAALLNDAELLVLDEPTVGLDPVLRRDLWTTFHRLAEAGTTLLVSSHVMDEAERCDELVLLRDGRVLAAETPAELQRQTATESVDHAFLALVDAADGKDGPS